MKVCGASMNFVVRGAKTFDGMKNSLFLHRSSREVPRISSSSFLISNHYSFKLVDRKQLRKHHRPLQDAHYPEDIVSPYTVEAETSEVAPPKVVKRASKKEAKIEAPKAPDESKRAFFRLAGLAGMGMLAATVLPKKAEAYVMGSAPATSIVGLKNAANTRINPATEGGNLATIAGKDFATQATLAQIKTATDQFQFDGTELRVVNSSGGAGASQVGILNTSNTQINPATEDSVVLLRRMVKLMESQATVDVANRQRITLDAWGAGVLLGTGTSASCPRVGLGTDSTVGTVTSVTNVATIGSYAAQQMYGDVAHDVYANALRRHLVFA
jgi:hypothetical protein